MANDLKNKITDLKNRITDPKRRAVIDAKYAIHHVGYRNWDIISKNIGTDMELWRVLFEAGKGDSSINPVEQASSHHLFCGEENYLSIRPELEKKGIVIGQTIGKKVISFKEAKGGKKKESGKAEKIRQENIIRKIKVDVDELLKSITTIPLMSTQSITFNYKFAELILVRMMMQCRNLVQRFKQATIQFNSKAASKYTRVEELAEAEKDKDLYYKELAELIVGFNKIFNEKQKNDSISITCLTDLASWISQAKEIMNFQASEVIVKMPQLIFKTCYDGMMEHKQIGLYPSQKEIVQFATSNQKYLALVHTMLAAGKTSLVLPFTKWLSSLKGKTKLVYCCPNEVVLLEVARMVYGMAVSFAIVIHNKEYNELEYKWSTFADKENPKESAVLYLCDVYVARILMEERIKCIENRAEYMKANKRDPVNNPLIEKRIPSIPDYILMGDELTKDADSQTNFNVDANFSLTTELFVDLMKLAPPKIILMSATLPTMQQLPDFYQAIIDANPGMVTKSFSSSEAKIGCALISNTGELYAPHLGCKNVDEIKHILSVIKTNPFMGRFYTFEVLLSMVETFQQMGITVPNLAVMYDDPSRANQTNIQQTAYSMLEQLIVSGSDELINQICLMKKNVTKPIDLSTIWTGDIGRFSRSCLIFSSDPVATAYQIYKANFDHFLNQKSDRDIFQQVRIDSILADYEREMDLFNKALERMGPRADETFGKEADMKDGANKIPGGGRVSVSSKSSKSQKVKSDVSEKISKMMDQKPVWKFPVELQLCSEAHLRKSKIEKNISPSGWVTPEDLPENSSIPIPILTMLASGIGIYSTTCPQLDEEYLQCVISLAKRGIVKFIITDSSIAYGTNLAVSDIIMVDEMIVSTNQTVIPSIVDQHSIKTIFQMLGRAGRGGNLSYEARIYTTSPDNKLINMISSYAKGILNEGSRDEIQNIRRAFELLWN